MPDETLEILESTKENQDEKTEEFGRNIKFNQPIPEAHCKFIRCIFIVIVYSINKTSNLLDTLYSAYSGPICFRISFQFPFLDCEDLSWLESDDGDEDSATTFDMKYSESVDSVTVKSVGGAVGGSSYDAQWLRIQVNIFNTVLRCYFC